MLAQTPIKDHTIWFKDIHDPALRARFEAMAPDEAVHLEIEDVVGIWRRMKDGRDGRPTLGIRPEGPMKKIWNEWYRARCGETVTVRLVQQADDFLAASSALFCEWNSPEDEAAFGDL